MRERVQLSILRALQDDTLDLVRFGGVAALEPGSSESFLFTLCNFILLYFIRTVCAT